MKMIWLISTIFLGLATIFLLYSFFESSWLRVKQIDFKDNDIPPNFVGKKIVFISDIHKNHFTTTNKLRRLVATTNKLEPDIVILGGDYAEKDLNGIRACFSELAHLQAKMAKFGILGNHDYLVAPDLVRQAMTRAGFQILDNQAQWLDIQGEKIKIAGVADLTEAQSSLVPTIKDVSPNDFVILISHNPDIAERLPTNRIDLILSGHTHGGQIDFFNLWAPFTSSSYGQKYKSGLVDGPNSQVIISQGIGTSLLPLRFFSRPEIVVVNLQN